MRAWKDRTSVESDVRYSVPSTREVNDTSRIATKIKLPVKVNAARSTQDEVELIVP